MSGKKNILYIVNFYGTPPLNYFEKYLLQGKRAQLTILKLPAVRSGKHRLTIEAFIKDEYGKTHEIKRDIFFPFPYSFTFFIQYIFNIFIAFILLSRIKRKRFDIIIGETNFGSALAYVLKVLRKGKFSVFFNGDILPKPSSSSRCFYLPNSNSYFQHIYKLIDTVIIIIQVVMRKIGYKNNVVWYGNSKIKAWDERQHMFARNYSIHDPIKIDFEKFELLNTNKKNQYDICYIGRIDDYVGLDIIIPAIELLKKNFPLIRLHIIGGSPTTYKKYGDLAKTKSVDSNIVFHGYVPHMSDAHKIMSHCILGLALYKPVSDNVSMFAQPAKPKDYIQVGIPVLLTRGGPDIGTEIVSENAGVFADFTIKDVCKTISQVLSDKKLRNTLQRGVRQFALKNDYKESFAMIWADLLRRTSV